MSTYRKIHGRSIQAVTTDPTESVAEGQVWYNTTSDTFKSVVVNEAWASTGSLLQSRDSAGGAGIQTAAMVFGGRNEVDGGSTGGPNAQYNLNEEYNGTGYSVGGALVQGRQGLSGAGTQTAGLGVGGYHPPSPGPKSLVEEYDGSSWSEVTNQPTATFGQGSAGTQTAAVVFGGRGGPGSTWTNATYEYDGTNWTTGGSMGTARVLKGAATGTQTAALAVGGDLTPPGGATDKVEEYDGTSFSEVNAAPTSIQVNMVSGIQTSALSFGGNISPYTTQTFKYDGTNFTASAAMGSSASGQNTLKTAPDNSTGLSMGGYGTSSYISTSQEFTSSANVITAATWASGTALPSARFNGASAGTATAGIIAGGELAPGTRTGETVYFDGSAWTAQPATLSPAPNADGVKMAGTQTAGILNSFRGGGSPGPAYTDARSWNGSAWSTIPSTSSNHSFSNLFRNGTPSAATTIGGDNETTGIQTAVEEYNGSSWGSETALPAGRGNMAAFGTPTAGVIAGGNLGPGTPNRTATALEYDGSSWTTTGSITEAATVVAGGGTQTTGIIFGGYNPSPAATGRTNTYDGTVFSTAPTMASARGGTYSIGDSSGAYAAGGNPPVSTTVEEFTPETTTLNVETLTQS